MAQDTIPSTNAPIGSSVHAIGQTGGEEKHVLIEAEMPSHSHTGGAQTSGGVHCCDDRGGYRAHSGESSIKGGNAPHNTMPPYYTLVYIMKL